MKIKNLSYLKLFFAVLIINLLVTSCEDDGVQEELETTEAVAVDSPLVNMVENASNNSNSSAGNCFDFVYPFTLIEYDANNQVVSSATVNSDAELNNYINTLSPASFISFGYPLTLSTANGNVTVNNDMEFITAIDTALTACLGIGGGGSTGSTSGELAVCDNLNDGTENVDLDTIFSFNLAPTQTVEYYATDADAQAQTNPLSSSIVTVTSNNSEVVFVRYDDSSNNGVDIFEIFITLATCP